MARVKRETLTWRDSACAASSLSIYFKCRLNGLDDYTFWVYPVLLMALVEMCVGITCACMPSAAGFFKTRAGGGGGGANTKMRQMAMASLTRFGRAGRGRGGRKMKEATGDESAWRDDGEVEMGSGSTEELRPEAEEGLEAGRAEIRVQREVRVER